ncbi:MAG TPA: pilin [Woeseiaceae bacterium]|nr:pilin [Woeseiaceae bacterium]
MSDVNGKFQQGFTLIELMIVVAIIGILASLALSTYQTYTVRTQVAEALNMAAHVKTPVVDYFNSFGLPPAGRQEAGLSAAATDNQGAFVSQIEVTNGRVDVTLGNSVNANVFGDVISFTPYLTPSRGVVWRCGAAPAPGGGAVLMSDGGGNSAAYIPSTLDSRYMPSVCRP